MAARASPSFSRAAIGAASRSRDNGFTSLAFPAISCGVYGYPIDAATRIAVAETRKALAENADLHLTFATFGADITAAYLHELET